MKQRPRSVENRVARELSDFFVSIGMGGVERIPVLGRTGPDISINEAKIVVDVKSRLQVPDCMMAGKDELICSDNIIGFRLSDVGNLKTLRRVERKSSKIVIRWLSHMDEWTQAKCKTGISCIILHQPGLNVKHSTVIIYSEKEEAWTTLKS